MEFREQGNRWETLLRRPEVEAMVGLSRPTIYARMAQNTFPRPVKLGTRAVAWRLSDIQKWISNLQESNGWR